MAGLVSPHNPPTTTCFRKVVPLERTDQSCALRQYAERFGDLCRGGALVRGCMDKLLASHLPHLLTNCILVRLIRGVISSVPEMHVGSVLSNHLVFKSCRTLRSGADVPCVAASGIARTASAPAAFCADFHHSPPEATETAHRRPELQVVTWNIAAPNNNPFEYWAMHEDEAYVALMVGMQECLDQPGNLDTEIENIFTNSMFMELKAELANKGVTDLDQLEKLWTTDLMKRKAISQFLKDTSFGEKRLISMPDRMTSSIKNLSGIEIFRPSPITGIQDDMSDIVSWWAMWKKYMFQTEVLLRGKPMRNVFSILQTIPRAKYPALSETEEALSIPLQTLCLSIFDAVFTHLLSCVAPETWQPVKRSLHKALYENKVMSCVSILQRQYADADIIFVQEASESFAAKAGVCMDFFVLRPSGVDSRRSQMSMILVRRSRFEQSSARDVTSEALAHLQLNCVENGDLCVFELASPEGPYLLASFHGDSSGKSTVPVLAGLERLAQERFPGHTLILGLDANTAADPSHAFSLLDVGEFNTVLSSRGLASCWQGQDLDSLWTTFSARTYLQPQLQKATGLSGTLDRRHMQLKDWILFYDAQLAPKAVGRDNTGQGAFRRAVMPSQAFPSDHAIVAATLRRHSCA